MRVCRREILFLRHGKTEWNDQLRFQGHVDIPLNDEGRMQVGRAARRLREWRPERVIGSPLLRALQTASAFLSRQPDCDFSVQAALAEMSFGEWESKSIFQIETHYGELYQRWKADPASVTPDGGESFEHVVERTRDVLMCGIPGGRTLVVSHGGVIRAALVALLGIPSSVAWKMRIDNASLTGVEERHGRYSLTFSNDRIHLLDGSGDPALIPIHL